MENEYTYETLKQNRIDGIRKKEFILSKFITVLFFAFAIIQFIFQKFKLFYFYVINYSKKEICSIFAVL
jgi:hypothetical protein